MSNSVGDRSRWQRWRGGVITVLVAIVVAVVVRTYLFESFYVPSGSMLPTIQIGDHMIVEKVAYDLHPVDFGNIVVFHTPKNDHVAPDVHFLVKRVIGLPGQVIWSSDGKVYINGHPKAEPFLPPGVETSGIPRQRIPKGDVYVLGDNRGDSADSRVFGPIPESSIVGQVILIYYPFSQWRIF